MEKFVFQAQDKHGCVLTGFTVLKKSPFTKADIVRLALERISNTLEEDGNLAQLKHIVVCDE